MDDEEREFAYYRQAEDFFAGMRGVVHVLSPRDVQLLRTWWKEQVPFAALVAGISEVFARRRAAGEDDPVVSLSFCRHAVRRHAKRLSEMRLGSAEDTAGGEGAPGAEAAGAALTRLASSLEEVATVQRPKRPDVATAILSVLEHVRQARELPDAVLDEHLFSLELALLERCHACLSPDDRKQITALMEEASELRGGEGALSERDQRALRDQATRQLLGLPHLELT